MHNFGPDLHKIGYFFSEEKYFFGKEIESNQFLFGRKYFFRQFKLISVSGGTYRLWYHAPAEGFGIGARMIVGIAFDPYKKHSQRGGMQARAGQTIVAAAKACLANSCPGHRIIRTNPISCSKRCRRQPIPGHIGNSRQEQRLAGSWEYNVRIGAKVKNAHRLRTSRERAHLVLQLPKELTMSRVTSPTLRSTSCPEVHILGVHHRPPQPTIFDTSPRGSNSTETSALFLNNWYGSRMVLPERVHSILPGTFQTMPSSIAATNTISSM